MNTEPPIRESSQSAAERAIRLSKEGAPLWERMHEARKHPEKWTDAPPRFDDGMAEARAFADADVTEKTTEMSGMIALGALKEGAEER